MAKHCEILFAESALRDLDDIRDWYTSQQVPDVGERLIRDVVARIEQLALYPDSGRIVPEFDASWLRELIHPPFRIVYRHDGDRVRIVRIWRTERQMDGALGGNV